ncbi:MAG: cell division protein ZapA [Flavobacteriaceae bacterium]|nr:cell division protein ZapA [Flavobacteriaceae bacterium]
MSDLIKIKIVIADRVYPLSIVPEQEEVIRDSAKKIDKMIKQLEQSYAVRDKQDVLAMCALQYAAQAENTLSKNNKDISSKEYEKVLELIDIIDVHLKTY